MTLLVTQKQQKTFEKGYTPRLTENNFTVAMVLFNNPVAYKKIIELDCEEIEGFLYKLKLQNTF